MERAVAVKRQKSDDSPAAETTCKSRHVGGAGSSTPRGRSAGPGEEDFITVPKTPSTPVVQRLLSKLENTVMGFGKHADKTYLWVFNHEPSYCNWAQNQDAPAPASKLKSFVKYLEWKQAQAPSRSPDTEVYSPPGGLGFTADYVGENLSRGLAGYCWEWLESGGCCGCSFKHSYPPTWTAAQREAHGKRAEVSMMGMALGYGSDGSDEYGGDEEDEEEGEQEEGDEEEGSEEGEGDTAEDDGEDDQ